MPSLSGSREEAAMREESQVEHLDVAYGPDEAHKIDFYQPLKAASLSVKPPLLVFVHGGAMRTSSRKDHAEMPRRLVGLCNVTVAVVDYRLTQPKPLSSWSDASKPVEYVNRHPTQSRDVFRALRFLMLPAKLAEKFADEEEANSKGKGQTKSKGNVKAGVSANASAGAGDGKEGRPSKKTKRDNDDDDDQDEVETAIKYNYDDSRVILVGHSIGAWMTAATLLSPQICHSWLESLGSSEFKNPIPVVCPGNMDATLKLTKKIRAWVFLDGIYDFPSLLDEYPNHRELIEQLLPLDQTKEYGSEAHQLEGASVKSWTCFTEHAYHNDDGPHMYLFHSTQDELLSPRQSKEVHEYLRKHVVRYFDGRDSEYDYSQGSESDFSSYAPYAPARLDFSQNNWGTHDGMLTNEQTLRYLAAIVEDETRHLRD